MLEARKGPLIFIRFGIQRNKSFLRDVSRSYNGLVLPANVLLYQYKSTPSVVFMCKKPYFVDPMSYLFGQPFEDFKKRVTEGDAKFKPSFDRLMIGHGLTPADFLPYEYTALLSFLQQPRKNLEVFVENTLGFQRDQVWKTLREASDLMTKEQRDSLDEARLRPAFLIPPYFLYLPPSKRGGPLTTVLNSQILDLCWQRRTEWGDIFPMVFLRREQLDAKYRDDILALYKRNAFPGYCVWINDFDERGATEAEVRGLIELTRGLANGGAQVVMLYGGFFSMLLNYFGLTSVCHGLAYGERRSIGASAQQGSGPAPIRYYVLELHCFLTLENALTVLRERPHLLCNCPACRRIVRGDPERIMRYQDEEAMAQIHFLYNRNQERTLIEESTLERAIENLGWTLELNEDIGQITRRYRVNSGFEERAIVNPAYIQAWRSALTQSVAT